MNIGAVAFLAVAGAALVALPRRTAVVPILLAAAYTTRTPVIEMGPANLSVLRVLVLLGFARVIARGERMGNGVTTVDRVVFSWAALLLALSVFHTNGAWTYRSGLVLGEVGTYVLCRIFLHDADDVRRLFRILCVAMLPLALLLLMEKYAAHNYFGVVGGFDLINMRDGRVRAYGPFAHPILAGTVGATILPMALALWKTHRARALSGLAAALSIVFASTSSGPVMMVVFSCAALGMWNVRNVLWLMRLGMLAAVIALQLVMNDPVYFLMARVDITGSSTGWHRAELIRSSLEHLHEWWAFGTDYTRHWMPTGIHANDFHTDITNHFLAMGVMGGLPLLIIFLLLLTAAFRIVGARLDELDVKDEPTRRQAFLVWTLGAMLFGQMINFWSISLFDQSVSFFYLVLAAICAIQPLARAATHVIPEMAASAAGTAAAPMPVPVWGDAHSVKLNVPTLGLARRRGEVSELGAQGAHALTKAGQR